MVWTDMRLQKRRGTNAVVIKRYYHLTLFWGGEVIFILIVKSLTTHLLF